MGNKAKSMVAALLLLGALTLLLGCGGSGDSTSTSLTKPQFIKQAKAICEKAEREQLELATQYLKKHPGAEEEEMIIPAGVPPLQKQAEQLTALPAPAGDEAKVDAFLAAFEEGIKDMEANPQDALSPASNPFKKANELGEKYGLTNCASAP
jgi:hypothetical protein